ncbi:uncharacterized protein LOC134786481 [Penaeus indicus]|uniref:uncharacterized protein LOC134786481 n=1 Tax=Penaeus indicus TaxID=29960 RepID=UPI00300C7C8A
MSRMLITRCSCKPRNSPGVRALSFDKGTVDDPQLSTSRGNPCLRNAPDPLLCLITFFLQRTHVFLRIFTEVEISGHFNDNDSDWEESESNSEESAVKDNSDIDNDYVPLVDTSLDSDDGGSATLLGLLPSFVWVKTTVWEFLSYIGIRFLMISSSVFTKTVSRARFDSLTLLEDRLRKLCPLIDVLDSTCRSILVPNKSVTDDKSLWAFKGRYQALQYNPSKRGQRGLKVCVHLTVLRQGIRWPSTSTWGRSVASFRRV